MAGLLNGMFGNNDAYKWFDQNRAGIGGGFAGLIGAKDFGQGAQGVAYGALNGNQADILKQDKFKAQQEEAQQRQQAADIIRNQYNQPKVADALIQGGLGLSDAWNNVLKSMNQQGPSPTADMQNWEYGQNNPGFLEAMNGQQQGPTTFSTTPGYATDANGNIVPIQYGTNGQAVQSQVPAGLTVIDPAGMAGQKAGATALGKNDAQAQIDLPTAAANAEQAISVMKGLLPTVTDPSTGKQVANKGFDEQFMTVLGAPVGQMTGAIPNTEKANFQTRLNQVQGQAFLQAFESLKGGGAISEVEGQKAQQAIMRASVSQTPVEFERAINEAIGIYEAGIARARQLASQGTAATAQGAMGGQNVTSTGTTWSFGQ